MGPPKACPSRVVIWSLDSWGPAEPSFGALRSFQLQVPSNHMSLLGLQEPPGFTFDAPGPAELQAAELPSQLDASTARLGVPGHGLQHSCAGAPDQDLAPVRQHEQSVAIEAAADDALERRGQASGELVHF